MKFIDLFAGLGGFHLALEQLGHECVFASDIDQKICDLYETNFGIRPQGDIRKISAADIPKYQILCAGFPCQPFSKAGEQEGTDCKLWGDLFEKHVLRIIQHHRPKYFIMENVANLERHNGGKTWEKMKKQLVSSGYDVRTRILSPHQFGVPQIRQRLFIVGSLASLSKFEWPEPVDKKISIKSVLDWKPSGARGLSVQVTACLNAWQDFLKRSPKKIELPSFPIWTAEFGATYPYEETTPYELGGEGLRSFKGSHGTKLEPVSPKERFALLPSYARTEEKKFPDWKIDFIRQNREFYLQNKQWIAPWLPKILKFPPSLQKFEWNCKGEERDIWKYVIQFRASGVRVKRPTTAPALVSMTVTQVPIIGWESRYMTPRECSRLQSMGSLKHLPQYNAHKALGNAVNAEVVRLVAQSLLKG